MIEFVAAKPCDHDRKLIAADWYEERGDADTGAALRWLYRRGAAPCCFYYTPPREVWRFTTPLEAFRAVIRRYVELTEVLR